jgi:hypothetical protein
MEVYNNGFKGIVFIHQSSFRKAEENHQNLRKISPPPPKSFKYNIGVLRQAKERVWIFAQRQ